MSEYAKPFYTCHEVSQTCPVEATVLGYYPNIGANITLAVGFGGCLLLTAVVGLWKRTWGWTTFVLFGCALEVAGYVSRIILHDNPWNSDAFQVQIIAIILAPTLLCVSIYLTLKHLCLFINPSLSRIRPDLYPFIFLPIDMGCLTVQAIGGGIATVAAHDHPSLLAHGNRTIIAGISLQVIVLSAFGVVSVDYFIRVYKYIKSGSASSSALSVWRDGKLRVFCSSVVTAYIGILIRCIYRIAEMAGGWGNPIMRDEPSFIVLEGFMILIPAISLAAFQPGIMFPQMASASRLGLNLLKRWGRKARSTYQTTPPTGSDQGSKQGGPHTAQDSPVQMQEVPRPTEID